MKHILMMISFFFIILTSILSAETNSTTPQFNNEGQIILTTISKLENKGYITSKNATEAKKEFVFDNKELIQKIKNSNTTQAPSDISWTEYISFINIIKLLSLLGFLFVFRGIIMNFIDLFTKVPVAIYQLTLLVFSVTLTFFSNDLWASQSFYLSNFGVIANIMVLAWIVYYYEDFFQKIFKLFSLNLPANVVVGFYLMLYFGFFAISLESTLLGLLSVVSFSAMFSFIMGSTGTCTYIGYEKEDYMNISMIVNGIILFAYSFIVVNNISVPYIEYFSVGIEYVCSLAFIVVLLINGSFYNQGKDGFLLAVLLMFVSFGLSIAGIYLFDMSVIPVIINTGFFIFILGWIGYLGIHINALFTIFVMSCLLYGVALLVEARPELFVTSLF